MTYATRNRGNILLVALVFFGIISTLVITLLAQSTTYVRSVRANFAEAQALALAEAGIDHAASMLNESSGYDGDTDIELDPGSFSVSVTTIDSQTREITATGYIPDSTDPIAVRTVRVRMSTDSNDAAFNFGVLAGAGGFTLSGGAQVNGSVYSNGSILATSGVVITGQATAANPPALTVDQANDQPASISSCTSSTCLTFGRVAASADVAQSFVVSSATRISSMQFYLRKVGAPQNITVRIVADSNGSPSGTTIMSATLPASSVGTSFGWASVSLPATPVLDPSETYWVVLDAVSNNSKYYEIGTNSGGYSSGTGKIGSMGGSWSVTSPSGLDIYFRLYLGGGTSMIGGNSYDTGVYLGTASTDDAWANTIMGATIAGTAYCQTISFSTRPCDTTRADPPPALMPVLDATIQNWKEEAEAGGTILGDHVIGFEGEMLGSRKIDGNLTVNGGGVLTLSGPLWVTGRITITGGSSVQLASTYGTQNGVIVADDLISISGGSSTGSGQPGSFLFFVSTSPCPAGSGCGGSPAISLSGGAGAVGLIAQNGTVSVNGGTAIKTIAAKQVQMTGGAILTYDPELQEATFSESTGSAWAIVPGTYTITD